MENFYTPEEIATRLKIHLQTVLNYIKDGRLKALKLDKGYRIGESDFHKFVHGTRVVKTPEDYFLRLSYQKKYRAFRKTSMKPAVPLPQKIPNPKLEQLLNSASVEDKQGYRAFPFPALSLMAENQQRWTEGILLEKEITFAGDIFFFAFASNQGEILTAESLWEDTETSQLKNSVGLLTSIGIICRGLLFIPRYYNQIPYNGEINYAFIIDKPAGRNLAMDSERPRLWRGGYTATTEDPIIIEKVIATTLTVEETQQAAVDMVKEFLWYFKCELNDDTIRNLVKEVSQNVVIT